ncbi:SDR family oxidoreductase [Paenibacillus piri]|uniref:SDR family oxidoreductase n=1 Tax=Paenibacillus piri TaxID=2547395 RepID=A0A4R5KS16_9BACL|nr:SDR family oxidoreductase [Paenibacillus piri]TDF98561.1 SDR family oxidoreductase [Paenibacillus piri]
MDLNLQGKNALVVASSQGLGKAIAAELVKEGANVMLSGRDADKLLAVKEELERTGPGKAAYHVTDITDAEQIRQLVQAARAAFGSLDIVVNNAGGPPAGNFEQFSDEDWQKAFELNLLSYIRVIREALPDLKEKGGRIVNLASSSIKIPIPGLILSNTFRTGIVGLTKTLAEELAPYNILVNTVAPGRIATDRVAYLDEVKAKKTGQTREQVEEQSRKQIPLGRYGTAEEFAKVVTFLVSDVSSYVTGSSIVIDGGMIKSI